ncbi:general secretion pathway protein GspB [Thioalkalivibrio sp. XN279]|uniref:general secretion pathway protein GspB n=1 Tax=Thioalkalivibrio sp. XN279 TaxID=2714953 RepID=UPI0014077D05|nr:general secretion pathway protein GspB [Thioalkalivibrio sp. XN279]NHA13830.1 general secretion pathway protein GspB [Thioalkalivibrio sp. XN279]
MSLILEALRKSEHERQREAGPALAMVPESRPDRRSPKWLPVLVVLLALNIVVLAAVLLRNSSPEPAAVTTTAPPAAAPAQPARATTAGQARETTVATPLPLPDKPTRHEVRSLTTELPPGSSSTSSRASAAPATAASSPAARTTSAAPADSTATATEDARLPRFADLVVRGELNVPHMHLDIHVYSGDPAERFVFINMRRYNEGNATQEGPKVERITRTGVVMNYQGQQFLLTRD